MIVAPTNFADREVTLTIKTTQGGLRTIFEALTAAERKAKAAAIFTDYIDGDNYFWTALRLCRAGELTDACEQVSEALQKC